MPAEVKSECDCDRCPLSKGSSLSEELTKAENVRLTRLIERLQEDSQTTARLMRVELDKEPAPTGQSLQQIAVLEECKASLERQLQVSLVDARNKGCRVEDLRNELEAARLLAARTEAEHVASMKELQLHIDELTSAQERDTREEMSLSLQVAQAELSQVPLAMLQKFSSS